MPTVTLTYTLPDEQSECDAAREGQAARSLIWEIDQRLRSLLKHGQPSGETRELAEQVREMIREAPGVSAQ